VFYGTLRIKDMDFLDDYNDQNSVEFNSMKLKIEKALEDAYILDNEFREGFESVEVKKLRSGSIITEFLMILQTQDANATWPLRNAVQSGKLGEFKVDPESLKLEDRSKPDSGKQTGDDDIGSGTKVGLIVFFVVVIIVIVGGGGFYYQKKKRGSQDFGHKHFENPVHHQASDDKLDVFGSQDGFAEKF